MRKAYNSKEKTWVWSPSLVAYDTGACTREEHDPAQAVLYYRPRNVSVNARTVHCGQLAGLIHFCRTAFDSPTVVKMRGSYVAMKHYGRFVLMMAGNSKEVTKSHLLTVSQLLDAAVGGIPLLWKEFCSDRQALVDTLSSLLDAILFHALPDVSFEDGIFASSSVSTSISSGISPSSDLLEDFDSERSAPQEDPGGFGTPVHWRKKSGGGDSGSAAVTPKSSASGAKGHHHSGKMDRSSVSTEEVAKFSEEAAMAALNREFNTIPSVHLAKSGGHAFLKGQQLLEVCQQHSGVYAGSISYQNRVLNTQIEAELELVLACLKDSDFEANEILIKKLPEFDLPKEIGLYKFNMSLRNLSNLRKSTPKITVKRGGRKGLHSEVPSKDLSTLRSALQNQSIHSYPSSISPLINKTSSEDSEVPAPSDGHKKPLDPLLLCAKISRNGDLLSDIRSSRSLPGSPRKIRVSTMLPDVGSDSPDLRYKVLTSRRQKAGSSSNNTPKRVAAAARNGNMGTKFPDGENGLLHRGNNLAAPTLKRKDFVSKNEQNNRSSSLNIMEANPPPPSVNRETSTNGVGYKPPPLADRSNTLDVNIKNTKNKLNLHFAPDKVNKPRDDYDTELKISREINGDNSGEKRDHRGNDHLAKISGLVIETNDDEDGSNKSEESEISVLELSSFIESKENGNKMFAEATRSDSPLKSDASESNEENSVFHGWAESEQLGASSAITNTVENQWTKLTLYVQKCSNMLLFLFLDNKASSNQSLIYDLYRLASTSLPEIEMNLVKILEMSEEREGGETALQKTESALMALDLASLKVPLVVEVHRDFLNHRNLTEITLRRGEHVLWGHKSFQTETFYQSPGALKPGLPIPSDVMARIPHRARRRLERDHGITLL